MQHAVGAPLPPPQGPGNGPAGWSHQAQHPGHPGPPGQPPIPPPPPGQAPHAPAQAQQPPAPGQAPRPPAPGHALQPQSPGQAAQYGWSGTGPTPPPSGGQPTGHVQLPPGGPVPLPAPPAEPGTGGATLAVLLIGPAGAGKTTVARLWAARRRVPTAHVSLDDVREWVCSGFADPQAGWNDHSEAQYRLARRTCGFAARNFLANGISCILDDAVFPDRPVVGLGGWKRHVGPGLLPVVLLPGLEIVLERNAARSGNRRLSDEEVARIHGRMAGWYGSGLPIIDNSTYDVETTARVLDDVLARSIASPPTW
ncbi:Pro-rich N-terminal domain-containing protein [Streptomyces sp. YIM 132580]|uniref:Pro-rich N-terminal domain-containing protein n=1 Tax=Streptomyces sp. YIM 132580 TaxID=2691958 RepID=UPI00136D4801|nr:Pro-rich N-terminal domain-containing protein [Streptomyces sp. YIM 132580]MXG27778.1 AAA family ATPase [Streptomyces sp. YIM 132580]